MTNIERIELWVIPLLGGTLWLLTPVLPVTAGVGNLLLWAAALFLFQGLVRDVWLLTRQHQPALPGNRRKARCICVESAIGATGVAVGLALLFSSLDRPVAMGGCSWSLLGMVVLIAGFALKDYVVEWHPVRLRREKDHVNIVFTWRR